MWIDKTPDEPGTGNANDLGPGARYPDRSARFVALGQLVGTNEQLTTAAPRFIPPFKGLSIHALLSHPGSDPAADVRALIADEHDRSIAVIPSPWHGCADRA